MLIQHGAGVTAKRYDGSTSLHLASKEGKLEVADVFIFRGTDVTGQLYNGSTLLDLASKERHLEVVEMLTYRGADRMAAFRATLADYRHPPMSTTGSPKFQRTILRSRALLYEIGHYTAASFFDFLGPIQGCEYIPVHVRQ